MAKKVNKDKYPFILADIAAGKSVRQACKAHGVPLVTFLDNVDSEQYARARDSQADHHFAEMAELEEDCLQGRIDPHAYRAAMDTRKWRLARMRPKVYGDRVALEHSGSVDITAAIAAGRERVQNGR